MPRTLKDILDHADELAERFEGHDPDSGDLKGATALSALRQAALERALGESKLADAVLLARAGRLLDGDRRDARHLRRGSSPALWTTGPGALRATLARRDQR
jgi:hypothetical protein